MRILLSWLRDFVEIKESPRELADALTMAGMAVGQRIRQRLSEPLFRKIFFLSLLALGAYLASRAFVG